MASTHGDGCEIRRKQVQESAAAAADMVLMLAASEVALLVLGCRAVELKAALIPALMEERVAEQAIDSKPLSSFQIAV